VQLHDATAPTYSDLGIDKTSASREQLVKRGEWLDWLAEYCPEISERTHNNYVRLYNAHQANPQLIADLTPMQAYKALGVVRDAIDTVKDFEPLPPPEVVYRALDGDDLA